MQPPLDYDWVTLTIDADLPDEAKENFDGGTDSLRDGDPVRWRGTWGPDVTVLHYPPAGRVRATGSPHKLLRGESVGAFGPSEMGRYGGALAGALGLPVDAVMGARVSRFDIAANLAVDRDAAEYVRVTAPPPQMRAVGSGPGSVAYKNTVCEVLLYDKKRKLRDWKLSHLIPESWGGADRLRVEARFKKPALEFKRAVTFADLCDDRFYGEAVAAWHKRVRSVPLTDGAWAVPFAETPAEAKGNYAQIGVQATGGVRAAVERIERAREKGVIKSATNARRQRGMVVVDLSPDSLALAPDLATELRQAVRDAVDASLRPRRPARRAPSAGPT